MRLNQTGEKSLIRKYVYPELRKHQSEFLGDDAAVVPLDDERVLVISTDAGPQKTFLAALQIGSWVDIGHFFAAISLSDIAAMGAEPVGLVAAFLLDPAVEERVFEDLVQGVSQACQEAGAKYLGGDTKESLGTRLVTTAIGLTKPEEILSRRGAKPGDSVFISGPLGKTVLSYLEAARTRNPCASTFVMRPQPKIHFARNLATKRLASCCIDMSDGPIAAARELSEINELSFVLDVSKMGIPEAPVSLWYTLVLNAGGDLELMFTAPNEHRESLARLGALECGYVDKKEQGAGVRLVNLPLNVEITPYEHFRSTQSLNDCLRSLV
jgi:thiamine-monophosphate kinase